MQIALEKTLRDYIQIFAGQADISMKDWILDNILAIHRKGGIEAYLSETYGSPIVLAPPTNAQRFNILIDDPTIDAALEEIAARLQRTKPQIVYTVITNLVNNQIIEIGTAAPTPAISLIR